MEQMKCTEGGLKQAETCIEEESSIWAEWNTTYLRRIQEELNVMHPLGVLVGR
jgi:hypothetical protein